MTSAAPAVTEGDGTAAGVAATVRRPVWCGQRRSGGSPQMAEGNERHHAARTALIAIDRRSRAAIALAAYPIPPGGPVIVALRRAQRPVWAPEVRILGRPPIIRRRSRTSSIVDRAPIAWVRWGGAQPREDDRPNGILGYAVSRVVIGGTTSPVGRGPALSEPHPVGHHQADVRRSQELAVAPVEVGGASGGGSRRACVFRTLVACRRSLRRRGRVRWTSTSLPAWRPRRCSSSTLRSTSWTVAEAPLRVRRRSYRSWSSFAQHFSTPVARLFTSSGFTRATT